jgi:septum formation protein
MSPPLFLASTSPRRRELLQQIGLAFSVLKVDVDESVREGELPADYVRRLASEKARAGLAQIDAGVVVAADTSVVLDDEVLGKPASAEEAMVMWGRLSGRTHQVLTGVAVGDARHVEVEVVSTRVHFRTLERAEMMAYWQSGEPGDKAGGYAIQGRGAIFVDAIEGSYSNVVGLPLTEVAALLAQFGIRVLG